MVIVTSNFNDKGGTHRYSGVKRAATSVEVEVLTPFSGMWIWLSQPLSFKHPLILCREEADNMCKMMATSSYSLHDHEDLGKSRFHLRLTKLCAENVEDKRIHATMYPVNATNLYKACMAGVRRQRYWIHMPQPANGPAPERHPLFLSLERKHLKADNSNLNQLIKLLFALFMWTLSMYRL